MQRFGNKYSLRFGFNYFCNSFKIFTNTPIKRKKKLQIVLFDFVWSYFDIYIYIYFFFFAKIPFWSLHFRVTVNLIPIFQ